MLMTKAILGYFLISLTTLFKFFLQNFLSLVSFNASIAIIVRQPDCLPALFSCRRNCFIVSFKPSWLVICKKGYSVDANNSPKIIIAGNVFLLVIRFSITSHSKCVLPVPATPVRSKNGEFDNFALVLDDSFSKNLNSFCVS